MARELLTISIKIPSVFKLASALEPGWGMTETQSVSAGDA